MTQKMSIFGIGPKFFFISVAYSLMVMLLNFFYLPNLKFIIFSKNINYMLGALIMAIGFIALFISFYTLRKNYKSERLATSGVFAFPRNPIYASNILLIVPGVIIISGLLLGITIPFFMYLVFKVLVIKEDRYLEEKFGQEYLDYKNKVGPLLMKFKK